MSAPLRADSVDLSNLVGHRSALAATESVENAYRTFQTKPVDFVAILDGERLLGMCSRQGTAALLGGRYGFSLWARKPIAEHLCPVETRVTVETPIGDVLQTVFARGRENFYDDVLLVDQSGAFLGLITTETLFKVQNALLLTNIRDLEERDREIQAKNEQMEADLRMAMELQQALMPVTYPFFPANANEQTTALRFYQRYFPANLVGGDFFHIARLNESAAGIFICDVMGHGVRAALVTSMLRALIEAIGPEARDPGALLTRLNSEFTGILKQTGTLVFATAVYCVIDVERGDASHARAGHPAPFHIRRTDNCVKPIASSRASAGPALGLIPDAHFETTRIAFTPGDLLLFFTDGIVEVENKDGKQFGVDGLHDIIASNLHLATRLLVEAITDQVYSFSGSSVFEDDVCLIAAERN